MFLLFERKMIMHPVLHALATASWIMMFVSIISPKLGSFGRAPNIGRGALALIWFLISFVFMGSAYFFMTDDDRKELQVKREAPYVEMLEEGMNTDKAVATKNWDILKKSGFTKITEVKALTNSQYSVAFPQADRYKVYVYTGKDKNIETVEIRGAILYKNGEVKGKLEDNYVTEKEAQDAIVFAKRVIRKELNDPSSAKFGESYDVEKRNGIIEVAGSVRAKNLFNATVQKAWKMSFDPKTHDYLIEDL